MQPQEDIFSGGIKEIAHYLEKFYEKYNNLFQGDLYLSELQEKAES